MQITPARVAAILTALSGVAGAIAVPAANLDTSSAHSVRNGVIACVIAGVTFLIGNSRWEVATAKAAPTAPQFSYTTGSTTAAAAGVRAVQTHGAALDALSRTDGPSDPAVPAVEGPPADPDEDTNVPTPNPKLGKPELDDPDWKPRKR